MSQANEYKGLCSTCSHASICSYRQNNQEVIWQCEEFTDRTPEKSNPPPGGKKGLKFTSEPGTGGKISVSEEELIIYKGLCVNCDHRNECKKEMLEGGIWHCENYE